MALTILDNEKDLSTEELLWRIDETYGDGVLTYDDILEIEAQWIAEQEQQAQDKRYETYQTASGLLGHKDAPVVTAALRTMADMAKAIQGDAGKVAPGQPKTKDDPEPGAFKAAKTYGDDTRRGAGPKGKKNSIPISVVDPRKTA